jgi:hypothetical protein
MSLKETRMKETVKKGLFKAFCEKKERKACGKLKLRKILTYKTKN